ncbi:MAG TPA: hypothetical protein VIV88_08575 [Gemmatimonadales bacterium]|jgi:hypothetical protein
MAPRLHRVRGSVSIRADPPPAIPKPDYITYLPRDIAPPVQATSGNRLFHLFGDSTTPGYRDRCATPTARCAPT